MELLTYSLSLCWGVHVRVTGCAWDVACVLGTPKSLFHFDIGFKAFIFTVGLLQKMTLPCKRSLEIMLSGAEKLIPRRSWSETKPDFRFLDPKNQP